MTCLKIERIFLPGFLGVIGIYHCWLELTTSNITLSAAPGLMFTCFVGFIPVLMSYVMNYYLSILRPLYRRMLVIYSTCTFSTEFHEILDHLLTPSNNKVWSYVRKLAAFELMRPSTL